MMNRQQGMNLNSLTRSAKSDSAVVLVPSLSQQTSQFRQQQVPSSRQMMTNMNPTLNRTGVGNGRMAGHSPVPLPSHCRSTHLFVGNPASSSSSSWGYSQQGQSTTNPLSFSQIQESSRPSSTNPYSSSSIQAFDRTRTGTPWQTTNLDPSDFPALGSGTSNALSHDPPSTPSYASTAGTGAVHQQRLQQQLGVFGRQSSATNDDSPFNISAPFSQDEFPALGGMSGDSGHSQRQGLQQHLGGQSNGVYDPRQQIMTPPPGSQSLQQAQDHRASMLEALQQGQRVPQRTGVSPNILAGRDTYNLEITSGSSAKDHRNSVQSFQSDDQKVFSINLCS